MKFLHRLPQSHEIVNILDGTVQRAPHPGFGKNQPFAKLEELAKAHGVPATTFEHYYVNSVINTGRELVLFDTGNGRGRGPTTGKLVEHLVAAGYRPEQIDMVVITCRSRRWASSSERGQPIAGSRQATSSTCRHAAIRRGLCYI